MRFYEIRDEKNRFIRLEAYCMPTKPLEVSHHHSYEYIRWMYKEMGFYSHIVVPAQIKEFDEYFMRGKKC